MRCHKILKYSTSYSSKQMFEQKIHDSPILHFDMNEAGQVFTGSCDDTARVFDINNPSKSRVFAEHSDAISQVRHVQELSSVVTGSWDKSICYWDSRCKVDPLLTVKVPHAVKCIDVKYPLMIVATSQRNLLAFDLRNPNIILKDFETKLKDSYTAVSLFPDKCGFILGSIEARCTIHWIDPNDSKETFSFKCHREQQKCFPVSSIDFHPMYGTFSTTGSDGVVNFWDKDGRKRLSYFPSPSKAPVPIGRFNRDGSLFAYGSCNDFYKGESGYFPCSLRVHVTTEKIKNTFEPRYRMHAKGDTKSESKKKL
jgi:mRNA export factor